MQRKGSLAVAGALFVACSGGETPGPIRPPAPIAPPTAASSAEVVAPPRADLTLPKREAFFGNPERGSPSISPDGKHLAFLAPDKGVLNVWVAPPGDIEKAKVVTKDQKRGIRFYRWTHTGKHLVYLQDEGGNEDFHLYAVDIESGDIRDLTPVPKVRAQIIAISSDVPSKILVGLNERDARYHDAYEIDVATGARKLVFQNDEGYELSADPKLAVRLATRVLPDAGLELCVVEGKKVKPLFKVGAEDAMTTAPLSFDKSGKTVRLRDSRGRDKAALVALDLASGATKPIHEPVRADVSRVLVHPKTREVQAVAVNHARTEWTFLDKGVGDDFAALAKVDGGDVDVVSATSDDQRWVVEFTRDRGPLRYYLWDRKAKSARFLFSVRPALEDLPLVSMHPVTIEARDGQELVGYLSLPRAADADNDGKPERPSPLVLLVHGGPWARDEWGYDPRHQWLASRGYAVLSVNYRGSTGFGKKFINLADKEWAGKMHDDLIDAVRWAIAAKIADEKKVAIFGGSYGGYSALVGLTFTPRTFACAVDIVGPSNLVTLLENVPAYWKPFFPMLTSKLADPNTEEGKRWLLSRSPLTFVDRIERPLLIGQGAHDPRVKQVESDQIVKAMRDKKIPVTYVLYPDEGHGFVRPENRKSFNAVAETFLAQCLGGPYEPVGSDFEGASITVPVGAEWVHGLEALLPR